MSFFWRNAPSSPASLTSRIGRRRTAPKKSRRPALYLEALEDRCVPATFNVNTLADLSLAAGVNANGTIGTSSTITFRSAIQAANNTPGDNTINLTVAGDYRLTLTPTNTNVVGAVVTTGETTAYTSAPTVSFTGGGGSGAAGFATINGAGAVTAVTITNGGTGYTSARPSTSTTPAPAARGRPPPPSSARTTTRPANSPSCPPAATWSSRTPAAGLRPSTATTPSATSTSTPTSALRR